MVPMNIEKWCMDFKKANKDGTPPEWKVHHDFISSYKLTDLSPKSMGELTERLYRNTDDIQSTMSANRSGSNFG